MSLVPVENATSQPITLEDGVTGDKCTVPAFTKTSVEERFLERAHGLLVEKTKTPQLAATPKPEKKVEPSSLGTAPKSDDNLTIKAKGSPPNDK